MENENIDGVVEDENVSKKQRNGRVGGAKSSNRNDEEEKENGGSDEMGSVRLKIVFSSLRNSNYHCVHYILEL